jgi:hypothetical protein
MPNPINQSRFQELVRKGYTKVYEDRIAELHQKEQLKDKLFAVRGTDTAYEEFYGVGSLPDIPRFNGTLSYLDVPPGYGVRIEPGEFAAGVEIERKLWLNNLYGVMKNWGGKFAIASHRTKEKAAIKAYANLNSAAFDFMPFNEEGVAIASTAHTTKADSVSTTSGFSNLGTTAFSPTAVEATRILMRGFRGDNGEILSVMPDGLIGPTTLDQKFEEVNATTKGLYSAEGTVNVQQGRWSPVTSQYFNDYSTKNWMMVDWSALKEYALWLDRISDEIKSTVDFETMKIKFSTYSYYGAGFTGWRFIYFMNVS